MSYLNTMAPPNFCSAHYSYEVTDVSKMTVCIKLPCPVWKLSPVYLSKIIYCTLGENFSLGKVVLCRLLGVCFVRESLAIYACYLFPRFWLCLVVFLRKKKMMRSVKLHVPAAYICEYHTFCFKMSYIVFERVILLKIYIPAQRNILFVKNLPSMIVCKKVLSTFICEYGKSRLYSSLKSILQTVNNWIVVCERRISVNRILSCYSVQYIYVFRRQFLSH